VLLVCFRGGVFFVFFWGFFLRGVGLGGALGWGGFFVV